jgi:hypothetical protein
MSFHQQTEAVAGAALIANVGAAVFVVESETILTATSRTWAVTA